MPQRSKPFWKIEPRRVVDFFTEEWGLKLMALTLAFLLWTVAQAEQPARLEMEIETVVENREAGNWALTGPPEPSTIEASFSGPSRELLRVALGQPRIVVPIDQIEDTVVIRPLDPNWVRIGGQTDRVRVDALNPNVVRLRFERVLTDVVPVSVRLTGAPVPGFEQKGPPVIEPAVVRITGRRSSLAGIDSLPLPPIDLSGRSATDTQVVVVDAPAADVIVAPPQVNVIIPIGPIGPGGVRERPDLGLGSGG